MSPLFAFSYHNPTQIHFGPDSFAALATLVPADARVLLLYGGGSIKANGVHAQVTQALAAHHVVEFGGVEPNPTLETLTRAVAVVREQRLDFILGVGGGSVSDGAKFVAAAALYDGEGWDIVSGRHAVTQALPVGVVLTLPATGSESNAAAVVTRAATREKRVFYAQAARPRFAILNPRVMASLPDRQLANGLVDAFVHVCEQYLTYPVGALVQDGYAEAVLRALKTLADTFERRREPDWGQNLMWAANQALCGIIGVGVPQDWASHRLAVQLTALYDIDHGRTLSIIQPFVLREGIEARRAKLEQMGRQVFGLAQPSAEGVIAAIEAMYRGLGMPLHVREAGVSEADAAGRVLALARAQGHVPFKGAMPLDEGQVERVIRGACG
ncbi:NADP-dependent alcohol dehydrogenase [Fluviicoccus keumensis]|uniref:NADP-dependent alcohol dehydrogenase n=1 Tax=Fluviicoccus keumensis TaxID=1435465 RepID=A0A4Q7ZCS9_9GAMM|nr:iron-containing alcohol dehydrogenase [Fluviicoccus keumensis]RZU48014.1 NADP-dependent alcohol dehydrogenase [Fluviicoccus keumensis]